MKNTNRAIIAIFIGLSPLFTSQVKATDNHTAEQFSERSTKQDDATGFVQSSDSYASIRNAKKLKLKGRPVTGWNQIYGAPVSNLRFVGALNFDVGGVYNPEGPALPIGADTSPLAKMASYAAPDVYLAFFGVPNAQNSPNQNILYADYPQILTHDENDTGTLPQLNENPNWFGKSNGAKSRDLTVRDWVSAKGSMKFICNDAGAYYKVSASNLIPGGLYTIWGFYFDQNFGSLMPDFAFGGTSANVFSADRHGKIRSSKDLSFCPQKVTIDDPQVPVAMFLVYHPDGRVHASVGHPVNTPPFIGPGVLATPQLMFAMPKTGF
jgi:hypothetical protein